MNTTNTQTRHHVPFTQLFAFGVGGIIPIALFNIAGQLMGLIGNISLGLSAFWLGVILIIPRLWDAISDPIVGHISDNTRSRWGRRRPYLLLGGIAVAISFVLMWWIPKGEIIQSWFPTESAYQWFQLGYILFWLLIFFTACTVFEIPHGALGMEMSRDRHERTRLFSAKSFFGNLFAMGTPWLFALANLEVFRGAGGNEVDGMRYVSIIIAAVLIPISVWWFLVIREPGLSAAYEQKKTHFWEDMKRTASNKTFLGLIVIIFTLAMGFNFVSLLNYYISIFYLYSGNKIAAGTLLGINGTIWAITGLLAVFPLNWISPKLGKQNTLILAIGFMCTAQLAKIVCYNPIYPYLVIIPTILLSCGMLFFFTLGASMVGDVCDEDDLKHGQRAEGSYYSVYWWFIKMGTAFASFVTGLLIVFTQFDETQVTRVDKIQGNIREIHAQIDTWGSYQQKLEPFMTTQTTESDNTDKLLVLEKAEVSVIQAIEKTKEQLSLRDKNLTIDESILDSFENQQKAKIQSRINKLKEALLKVRSLQINPNTADITQLLQDLQPLILSTLVTQAVGRAVELEAHFQSIHNDSLEDQHIKDLLEASRQVKKGLQSLLSKTLLTASNTKEVLNTLDTNLPKLSLQAPHTLLRMRIVEIGLPLLLSLISIWFALRYPLTEQRCLEIKLALDERNSLRIRDN